MEALLGHQFQTKRPFDNGVIFFNGCDDGFALVSFQCNRHLHLLAHYLGCVVGNPSDIAAGPKRYAVTPSHLFADGQKYSWDMLRLPIRQPKKGSFYIGRAGGYLLHFPLEGPSKIFEVVRKYIRSLLSEEQ